MIGDCPNIAGPEGDVKPKFRQRTPNGEIGMNYEQLVNVASKLSLATLLIIILVGGYQGLWVYGPTYKQMVAERDEWKSLALKGANVATQAAQRALPVIGAAPQAMSPLPRDARPDDVAARLQVVDRATSYKTEPTDEPQ